MHLKLVNPNFAGHRVRICDMQQVFYFLNMGLSYIEMEWPSHALYALAGKTGWGLMENSLTRLEKVSSMIRQALFE
jgi:hypothetical protein